MLSYSPHPNRRRAIYKLNYSLICSDERVHGRLMTDIRHIFYLIRQVSSEQILIYNEGNTGPIVRRSMGLPITASRDTTWNRTRVFSDTSSTEMQCLRPLHHSGAQMAVSPKLTQTFPYCKSCFDYISVEMCGCSQNRIWSMWIAVVNCQNLARYYITAILRVLELVGSHCISLQCG